MKLSAKILHIQPAEGKFAPIDGLRGYMAFFVFLHHSCIWYFFTHGYSWSLPPSIIYTHFGPTSVFIFFMITSFLFFSKLLQARSGTIDWLKLYVSRGLRILPLYGAAVFILALIVGIISHFELREPATNVLWEILQWLVYIKANINGVFPTWLIIAGVVWSLPYEWLFYFTLPLLGLFLNVKASLLTLIFSITGLLFFLWLIIQSHSSDGMSWMNPFLGGIAAAFFARHERAKELVSGPMASFCILVLLVVAVGWFPNAHAPVATLLLIISFIGMACGNSLFGLLTHPLSRILGQISYSVYLLHGIILFVVFNWILGFEKAGKFSPLEHWTVITISSIAVVLVCSVTYRFIERPALKAAPAAADRLKKAMSTKAYSAFR